MSTWRQSPPLRRGILTALLISLVVAVFALSEGISAALLTFLAFGSINVAFFVAWSYWDTKPRRVSFERVWLAVVAAGGLVLFAVVAAVSGIESAALAVAPIPIIIVIWLALRRFARFGAQS